MRELPRPGVPDHSQGKVRRSGYFSGDVALPGLVPDHGGHPEPQVPPDRGGWLRQGAWTDDRKFLVPSRLHDFGFRGCTCAEQSVIGGCAHLLSFEGSDTMSAAYYAQFVLNGGKAVASSIPATEHSVMMSWETEKEAIENMIEVYGDGSSLASWTRTTTPAPWTRSASVASKKNARGDGGYMVLRPDSGDPVEVALIGPARRREGLWQRGQLKGVQGDQGLRGDPGRRHQHRRPETNFWRPRWRPGSAENVAFGMGGGLLQKVNRDTMSFATKLSGHRPGVHGRGEDRDEGSKDGRREDEPAGKAGGQVRRREGGMRTPTVFPKDLVSPEDNLLEVVYDHKPVGKEWDSFGQGEGEGGGHLACSCARGGRREPGDEEPAGPAQPAQQVMSALEEGGKD